MTAAKKTAAKKVAAKKVAAEPVEEALIRVAFTSDDLFLLLQQVEGWDSPIAHRLRMRLSKHRLRHPR